MANNSSLLNCLWISFFIFATGTGVLSGYLVSNAYYECLKGRLTSSSSYSTSYSINSIPCNTYDNISGGIIAGIVLVIVGALWCCTYCIILSRKLAPPKLPTYQSQPTNGRMSIMAHIKNVFKKKEENVESQAHEITPTLQSQSTNQRSLFPNFQKKKDDTELQAHEITPTHQSQSTNQRKSLFPNFQKKKEDAELQAHEVV
ncbi:700_t:CDS:1 [Racocetra persica]|uniref:700_t:CDS:1 n=1 Tax=Racocetra persica TaxID=160502 RepID=A0ACA9NK69_9GLOM|nr:700_t:CDS:1 [Racocetra persica]